MHGPLLESDNENKRIEIFDNDYDIGHGMLDNNKIILSLDKKNQDVKTFL